MRLSRRRLIAISAAAAIAPGSARAAHGSAQWTGTAMGASASLKIVGVPHRKAQELISSARTEIKRLENQFSLYRNESTLSLLNKTGSLPAPPFEFLELLNLVDRMHEVTAGAFDPTVQTLWNAYASTKGCPSAQQVADALGHTGWKKVRYGSQSVSLLEPGIQLTFNGIAQGYVTDQIAILLRQQGLRNVLVSVGEIAAIGAKSLGTPWRVGVAETGDGVVEELVSLRNAAIATSAPLGTHFDEDGSVGHIINPRTGKPGSSWRRISVIHNSAAIADALSTAFAISTRDQILDAVKAVKGARVIGVGQDGARLEYTS